MRTAKDFWDESLETGYLSFIEDEFEEYKTVNIDNYYDTSLKYQTIVETANHDLFSVDGTFLGYTTYNSLYWLS